MNKIRDLLVILALNCVPLAGLVFLQWEPREIFLFYSLELSVHTVLLIPVIVIFAKKSGDAEGKSAFGIGVSVFLILIYHAVMFLLAQSFLIHAAYAPSAGEGAFFTAEDLAGFLFGNILFVLFLVIEYGIGFYFSIIRKREYRILSCDYYAQEIYFGPVLLVVAVGIIYGISAALRLAGFWHALGVLAVIIPLKTLVWKLQNDSRVRELREYREVKSSAKVGP